MLQIQPTSSFIAVHDMILYVVVMIWRQSLGDAVARLRVEVLVVVVGGVLRVLLITADCALSTTHLVSVRVGQHDAVLHIGPVHRHRPEPPAAVRVAEHCRV